MTLSLSSSSPKAAPAPPARVRWMRLVIALLLSGVLLTTCAPPGGGRGRGGDPAAAQQGGQQQAGGAGAAGNAQGSTAAAAPTIVEAFLVGRGLFYPVIETSTTIRGVQEVNIISETSGKIMSLNTDLGERVTANQILVTLDNELETFAVRQTEDQLEVAEFELAASTRLLDSNNTSQASLIRARASVSGSRSALAQTRRALQNRIIRSPITGRVATLAQTISPGNYVQPGTRIATIVDLSRLQADLALSERDILLINIGDSAQITLSACGDVPQQGTVSSIAAGAEANGTFIARVEFVNRCGDAVKSGMSAQVAISNSTDNEEIIIPSSAVLNEDNQYHVYTLVRDGSTSSAAKRTIDVGRVLGNRTEIIAGLNEGDLLILSPLRNLRDGQLVEATSIRGN